MMSKKWSLLLTYESSVGVHVLGQGHIGIGYDILKRHQVKTKIS